MLYLKKYFTEGLIQMAILLSLCGVRVDVGLEPYLPPSWHEMILGPTMALTQTQFHNFRNSLEDGHGPHLKNVDLDSFFTTRRLLGWVHSLDRLQVPYSELETWLVQREPDPYPMECPDQPSPLEGAPTGEERDHNGLPVEPRGGPTTLQEELSGVGARRGDLEPHPIVREPQLSPIIPTDNPCLDLELHWQDLFAIMEPENKDFDMMTSFDHTPDSEPSEAPQQNCSNPDNDDADQVHLMETPPHQGLLSSLTQTRLLPLTPSTELDDHSPAFNNSNVNTLHSAPDHMDLLAEDFSIEQNVEDSLSAFNMNLLTPDLMDNIEGSLYLQHAPYPGNLASFDVDLQAHGLTPSISAISLHEHDMTQDLLTSPSSAFVDDKEKDFEDGDNLYSPLSDLLDDVAMLDDIRLLDLALDEDVSPEMAERLEEESYLDYKVADDHSVSGMAATEDQSQPRRHQQDGEAEADSDSGLSLDFSHSPASPCASDASSYSSSSSSPSDSASSCVSSVGSPFSEDREDDAEEKLVGSDMEVELTIKQEEDEEEIGAVGGWYPEGVNKVFPANYEDHKLFNGFSWQEHINHDHTYNQPLSSGSSPTSVGKMQTKHSKSSPQHDNIRRHHYSSSRRISKANAWSRDEQHARSLKIPFSIEVIVNLPVEEFNDLLTNYQLSDDQVTLIRDIRRRGKNKIAAQNCRKRKLDVLLGLDDEVSCLRRHRSWLLREKQEALKKLKEMKRQLGMLYQEVFSRLRDENGMPLDGTEYQLHFEPSGSITVAPHQQESLLLTRREKNSKKKRENKK